MDKITAMKLTMQDMMSIMSQAGVSPNGASTTLTPMSGDNFPSGGFQGGGDRPSGGMPVGGASGGGPQGGGVPPSGNFPAGGDAGTTGGFPGASTTPQAGRQNMGNQVPMPLLNALIQLLQKKIQ
jgi:hypothetical protein